MSWKKNSTHCKKGLHPWIQDNIYKNGKKSTCRTCMLESYEKNKILKKTSKPVRLKCKKQLHDWITENIYVDPRGRKCCKICKDLYHSELKYKENYYKKSDLRRRYGITLEDYENLMKKQESKCAICNQVFIKEHLKVDHDHKTNIVRGLLCHKCNTAIGLLNEDIDIITSAIDYLNRAKILI